LHPILTLLLHNNQKDDYGNTIEPRKSWNYWFPFVNLSITPNECSIVCPREEAEALFAPIISGLSAELQNSVSISEEDFISISVSGEGLEAGQRVLDLTTPLALAGIPIFFITSYYSDFILVPLSARSRVIGALEAQGFVFEASDDDGEAGEMWNPASPLTSTSHQRPGSASSFDFLSKPVTPPPTSISELQTKTFKLLARNNIVPHVDRSIELVTCAGIKDSTPCSSEIHFTEGKLDLGVSRLLCSVPAPRFFSLTLTENESASFTMERRLLEFFPDGGEDLLQGMGSPEQIPITLDLQELPRESTGIVCGVSSRLTDGMRGRIGGEMFNMSYLSTSKAGHVIVYEHELDQVMEALEGAQKHGCDN
jgi:cellobiose dehydrogenase (acceptor)